MHYSWRRLILRSAAEVVSVALRSSGYSVLETLFPCSDLWDFGRGLFYVGGCILLLEWTPLIVGCLGVVIRATLQLLLLLLVVIGRAAAWCHQFLRTAASLGVHGRELVLRTDNQGLTCDRMAALVPAGVNSFPIGTFAKVSRPPHYDEVWVAVPEQGKYWPEPLQTMGRIGYGWWCNRLLVR